jgi:hypothetical protein
MCPSGQATIRTGCTPDLEGGSAWEEDRWGADATFVSLGEQLRQQPKPMGRSLKNLPAF